MDIILEYKKRYHNDLMTAAMLLDPEAAEELETGYKSLWAEGQSFARLAIPGEKRNDDSEEQVNGFCQDFDKALRKLVLEKWVRKYDRTQFVTLLTLLYECPSRQYTRVTLAGNYAVTLDDIRLAWNDTHPGDAVCLPDPDM